MRASRRRGPCWEWSGGRDRDDYGRWEGRAAHRVVYERLIGTPLGGLDLHHRCENKQCVNPWHMEVLTRNAHAKHHGAPGLVAHALERYEANVKCPQGHDRTPENTYEATRPDGRRERHCRQCRRERWRAKHGKGARMNRTKYNPSAV